MRLIDVDALPSGRVEWEDIVDAPTVDPVRHGKWKVAGRTTHYYTCSVCGKPGDGFDNYCRSCGAKMDADADADGKR